MKSWILSITATGILTTLLNAVAPKTSVSNTVRLCSAILMVLCVLSPVKKIINGGFEWGISARNESCVSEEDIFKHNELLKGEIIKDHVRAYVLKRAKQLGIDCEVSVEVSTDVDGHAVPSKILVICKENEQEKLREIIQNECGIEPIFRTNEKE